MTEVRAVWLVGVLITVGKNSTLLLIVVETSTIIMLTTVFISMAGVSPAFWLMALFCTLTVDAVGPEPVVVLAVFFFVRILCYLGGLFVFLL